MGCNRYSRCPYGCGWLFHLSNGRKGSCWLVLLLKLIIDERIIDDFIRDIVDIDDMQFGIMPGRGTTDAIFIVRQIQEAYIRKNQNSLLLLT